MLVRARHDTVNSVDIPIDETMDYEKEVMRSKNRTIVRAYDSSDPTPKVN